MANFSAGTADVEIGPDFTNFVKELRADLDRVEANYAVEIKAATAGFARELQDYLDTVIAALDVEINADTSGLASELETKLGLIRATLGVEVEPDQASLDSLEAAIRAKIALMDLRATVKIDADTATAANELAGLFAAYRSMTTNVDADTTAAAAQIGALNGIPVRVNVRTDTNRSALLSSLGGPLTINAGVLGISQLPAMASLVATIGTDVQALAQNALLLPGAFAAAGAGIATLTVGLDGMKDAFAEGAKGAKAYQELTTEGRSLVDVAKRHGDEWDRVGSRIQSITLAGLSQPLDSLITTQLPAVERGMGLVAGSMNRGFGTLLTELSSDKSVATVDKVFGNTAHSADILNTAIRPIISSVETLAGTGSDKLPRLSQAFADAATRLDTFLTRADNAGDLSNWMDRGIDAGGRLLSVLGNVGSILASVLRAGRVDGESFLQTADRLTEQWAAWLKGADGQATLITFLREGREQAAQWKPILSDVGSVLVSVYEASQAWSAILMPFLRAAASVLTEHDGILRTVLVSYLAYRTLSPIFSMIQTGWASATTAVGRYNTAQATAAGAGGAGAMRSGLAGIGAMLGPAGWVTLAVAGAAAGLGILATKHQDAANAAEDQRRKLEALRETLDDQTGSVTKETVASTTKDLEGRGFLKRAQTLGVDPQQYVQAGLGLDQAAKDAINSRLTQIILEQTPKEGYGKLAFQSAAAMPGMDATTVARALQGIPEAIASFDASVMAARAEGARPADLAELKAALNDVGESAATLGGEMNGLNTSTGQAAEAQRRINETLTGTFQLTEQGKKSFQDLGLAVNQVPNEKTIVVDSTTEEQQRKLEELGYTVTHMEDGKVKIVLNDAGARASIAELVKPEVKVITLTTGSTPAGGQDRPYQDPASYPRDAEGNRLPGRALGGPITGGVSGRDSVPIMAMPGEHMLTTSDVDRLGGQAGVYRFRAALQAGLVRPMRTGGAVKPWDDGDEIDLQQAINAVDKARRAREELETKKGTGDEDRRGADLKIQELELKVRELEDKKAGKSSSSTEVLPQQELPGRRSNSDLDKADADAAVDKANTERNRVYATGGSDEEKAAADRALIRAQNSREEAYKTKGSGSDGTVPEISLPGIAASAAGILAEGFLSALGLENSVLSGNNVYTKSLNSVLKFYGDKGKDNTSESGGYGYTPKNLPQERESESSSSSSSGTSTEGTQSADNYDSGGGVEQWRPTFASVLRALEMPASWVDLGLVQMKFESGGNPRAINNWDSNAAKGTPSKGLMQVIDPTFASNRSPLYPNDIWDPGANIAAALRYTVGRYGSPTNIWGKGTGYRDGGWVFGPGGPRGDGFLAPLSDREFVVQAGPAETWGPQLEAINAGLPLPLPPLPTGMTPRGSDSHRTVNRNIQFNAPIQLADHRDFIREMERHQAIEAQGAMAGLPR